MKNMLTRKTIRAVTLPAAVIILTLTLTLFVNTTAVSGQNFDVPLHVISGDPSILAGMSLNIWASRDMYYYGVVSRNDSSHVSHITRNKVSFYGTGEPAVKSYSQVNAKIWLASHYYKCEDYWLRLFEYDQGLALHIDDSKRDKNWENPNIVNVPGFQVEGGFVDYMAYAYDHRGIDLNRYINNYPYLIDENVYFTITCQNIQNLIDSRYKDSSVIRKPDMLQFSLPSGIFRSDGASIENIFPIETNNENGIFDMIYIPQTRCFALSTGEKTDEGLVVYAYIYHLETGEAEKYRVCVYRDFFEDTREGEWNGGFRWAHSPRLFVNDNLLFAYDNGIFACIRTSETEGSAMLDWFQYNKDIAINNADYADNWYRVYEMDLLWNENCVLSRDGYFFTITIDQTYDDWRYGDNRKTDFSGYRINIHVFKESELVFSGYMLFSQEEYPAAFSISDDIPLITEDGIAVKRWAGG